MQGCLGVHMCEEEGVSYRVFVFFDQALLDMYAWVGAIRGFGLCVKKEQRCLTR